VILAYISIKEESIVALRHLRNSTVITDQWDTCFRIVCHLAARIVTLKFILRFCDRWHLV